MYHFPNQQLYHHHHNPYQQCPPHVEETKLQNLNPICEAQYHHVLTENVGCNPQLIQVQTNTAEQVLRPPVDDIKMAKIKKNKKLTTRTKSDDSKQPAKKPLVDTSTFSIEERLVAAVWVHERKHTSSTISEIKYNFRRRFGRDPPSKTTLFAWERKLFSTGNVCDAPRTGRPVNRQSHLPAVAASLRAAPALSLRARALALRLPRTTLHYILRNDLRASTPHHKPDEEADCESAERRIKQPPRPRPRHAPRAVHTGGHGYT